MNDYERIAKVLRHVAQRYHEQTNLNDLAQAVGLSPSHFHRLFQRWAGVTPKQFLQHCTAKEAKQRLLSSQPVLQTAFSVGLSSGSRLYDLTITTSGVSPGDIQKHGAGLTIQWGQASSPFGDCVLAWSTRGLTHLAFLPANALPHLPEQMITTWPQATYQRNDQQANKWAQRIFVQHPPQSEALRLWLRGSAFQMRVWQALLCIPEGCVCSYTQLAQAIGKPRAARAVGNACGANPIAYLIPCHRVIRETGIIDGYRWGSERKRAMIAVEGCPHQHKKSE